MLPACHSSPRVSATGMAPLMKFSFLALIMASSLSPQFGLGSEKAASTLGQSPCRSINLNVTTKTNSSTDSQALATLLGKFERAFLENDPKLFAQVASSSLQKKREELEQIFEGTVLEYDLQRARLQRNSIWELNVGDNPQPGKTLVCGENEIQPVFGPSKQIAVMYSAFSAKQQTRILVLFANTRLDTQKDAGMGLVLLQVQRWTYDGRSPEKLLAESLQHNSAGEPILAQLLSEAAARILESNPYLIMPLYKQAREQADRFTAQASALHSIKLKPTQIDPVWVPEKFSPVFKDGSLAVGLKVRMNEDLPLNDQTQRCLAVSKKIFAQSSVWRKSFSGVECMAYQKGEDLSAVPKGGSQFFPWSKLDTQ